MTLQLSLYKACLVKEQITVKLPGLGGPLLATLVPCTCPQTQTPPQEAQPQTAHPALGLVWQLAGSREQLRAHMENEARSLIYLLWIKQDAFVFYVLSFCQVAR